MKERWAIGRIGRRARWGPGRGASERSLSLEEGPGRSCKVHAADEAASHAAADQLALCSGPGDRGGGGGGGGGGGRARSEPRRGLGSRPGDELGAAASERP